MAILADLLRGILTQDDHTAPMNRLAMISGDAGTAGPIGSEAYQNALSSLSAPQQPVQAGFVPSAPQGQGVLASAPQAAPQAAMQPSGGGFGDFLGNLFDPQRGARNRTVDYLRRQGLDDGTATLLAGNKGALQQYLLRRSQGMDPKDALQTEKLQLEIERMRSPTTNDLTEYEYARKQGYSKPFNEWMLEKRRAGAMSVDARQMGNIPPGYRVEYDDQNRPISMAPVPGSPAALEAETARRKVEAGEGARGTVTDTITSQAQKARDLIGRTTTGAGGWALSGVPFSDAADMYRYVGSLKSIAAAENLQAMRAASPTGGALGNASDADIKLLQDKAGALDPASPNFPAMLDEYERSLLRIIHGPTEGDRIFDATRKVQPPPSASAPAIGAIEDGYRFKGGNPSDPNSWERVQ